MRRVSSLRDEGRKRGEETRGGNKFHIGGGVMDGVTFPHRRYTMFEPLAPRLRHRAARNKYKAIESQ
ncbi:hypothetical protein EYF80_048102 [Liparis tanakae]|uniref:Uncharacterized protein n=1 Tax=Liparis tanakae TaxID=230148 RepID=A0A4Z2FKQ4_9TELE|nr:hypothetical protein EYF80_048102 [Liparis tanakae]